MDDLTKLEELLKYVNETNDREVVLVKSTLIDAAYGVYPDGR